MGLPALDNLVRAGELKSEPRDDAEIGRLLAMACTRLADAKVEELSTEGRFLGAYHAAHAAALAALRWHGYRSNRRYLVFQCLSHTLGWRPERWRVLEAAHRKRNLAEYEGQLEVGPAELYEIVALAAELLADVERLTAR